MQIAIVWVGADQYSHFLVKLVYLSQGVVLSANRLFKAISFGSQIKTCIYTTYCFLACGQKNIYATPKTSQWNVNFHKTLYIQHRLNVEYFILEVCIFGFPAAIHEQKNDWQCNYDWGCVLHKVSYCISSEPSHWVILKWKEGNSLNLKKNSKMAYKSKRESVLEVYYALTTKAKNTEQRFILQRSVIYSSGCYSFKVTRKLPGFNHQMGYGQSKELFKY